MPGRSSLPHEFLSSNCLQVLYQSRSTNFFDESLSQRSQEGVRYFFSFMVCHQRKVQTVTCLLACLDKLEVAGVETVGESRLASIDLE